MVWNYECGLAMIKILLWEKRIRRLWEEANKFQEMIAGGGREADLQREYPGFSQAWVRYRRRVHQLQDSLNEGDGWTLGVNVWDGGGLGVEQEHPVGCQKKPSGGADLGPGYQGCGVQLLAGEKTFELLSGDRSQGNREGSGSSCM